MIKIKMDKSQFIIFKQNKYYLHAKIHVIKVNVYLFIAVIQF